MRKRLESYMKNRKLQIGEDFLHKSLYDSSSLQHGRQEWHPTEQIPLPFKVYQNTERYPLHQAPPLTLGDPRQAFYQGEGNAGASPVSTVETKAGASPVSTVKTKAGASPAPTAPFIPYESLSTLLYYTYGFSRHDEGAGVSWPFHRFVASARCFFPTELYLWLPQTEHIPTGIYHYDNLHHSLALIREGEYRDILTQALDTDLENCLGVLLISTHFWKTAFKYINFAYRLCTQEAGIVTSNALLVAGTLGYTGRVHYQFLDQPLNRLLGFVPDEESLLTVLPLYAENIQDHLSVGNIQDRGTGDRKGREGTSPNGSEHLPNQCVEDGFTPSRLLRSPGTLQRLRTQTTEQSLSETIAPIALDYIKTTTFDRQLCPILTEMDQHTFLEDTTEIVTTHETVASTPCLTTEERIAPPAPSPEERDLAEALHFRSSGDMNFLPSCLPLGLQAFWEIVRYSLTAYHSDLQHPPSSPHLQLYIVIQNVEGIEAGIYRLCADCGMLHVIARGDFSSQVQLLQMVPNVVSAPANLVCYLAGDYGAKSHLFGNRAYRIMNLEAGLIAQRICTMSAAHGLTARYSNSYLQPVTKALLKLRDTSIEPLAELVIGYEQPGTQAGNRYRFSLLR
jgi:SagB-type dehydrogenase family enzyme